MLNREDQLIFAKHAQDSAKLTKLSCAAIFGVLISRASGLIRTIIVNACFGAGLAMDAFNLAFRFPNALRDLFADGALSAAFMKVLIDVRAKGQKEEQKLISIVISLFLLITLCIAILFAIYSYNFILLIGNQSFKQAGGVLLASQLFKILAFYLPITMLNAIAMGTLGVLGKTFKATNASIFLSVGMILGSLVFAPIFAHLQINTIFALAYGAMLGAILQLIYQFIPLFKLNLIRLELFIFPIKEFWQYKPIKEILYLMLPRAIGQGALTLALFINTMFALSIGSGVLTYIVTTITIIQVPIGLFGVASSFAALPMLTKTINDKQYSTFSKLLVESLELTLWLSILSSIAFSLFIVPIYYLLFQHGKITAYDNIQNSIAVCVYSIGIIFSCGSKVLTNCFYAILYTRQVSYNALAYLSSNALLSSILAPKFGILGLGLSYSITTSFDFFLNYYFFKLKFNQKLFSQSPYYAGGKYFFSKILIFSLSSYIIGLSGVLLVQKYWTFYLPHINNIKAIILLAVGGILYALICGILLFFYGPRQIKIYLGSRS